MLNHIFYGGGSKVAHHHPQVFTRGQGENPRCSRILRGIRYQLQLVRQILVEQ